jgi:hypothetical protein
MDDSNNNTLPDPDLNPLSNPLLAANMGRWAEVYFTSPPERREQAVAELIRELGGRPATEPVADPHFQQEPTDRAEEVDHDQVPLEPSSSLQHVRTCAACDYQNSEEQNFCGMCGSPLPVVPASEVPQPREQAAAGANWKNSEPFTDQDSGERATEAVFGNRASEEDHESDHSIVTSQENDLPHFARQPEPVPYRYRLYVGTILGVLLVLLVYMSWRGTKAISGAAGTQAAPSRVMPEAPSAVAHEEQPPAPVPAPAAQTITRSQTAPPAPPATPREKPPVPAAQKNPVRDTQPAARIVTKASNSSAIALEQSSEEDLATAQKFLSRTPRDSRQASTWLWKAVSKGNPTATIELSDLYLRGDGVPKSCDQARILLDAAARKGQHAAAERIRNLPAFGCQ